MSDRSNYMSLYKWSSDTGVVCLLDVHADMIIEPQWIFGQSNYVVLDEDTVVLTHSKQLFKFALSTQQCERVPGSEQFDCFDQIRCGADSCIAAVVSSPTCCDRLVRIHSDGIVEVLRKFNELQWNDADVSVGREIEFPTENDQTSFANYYPPCNSQYNPPAGELPPLLVKSHGGPTSIARTALDPSIQYWTSRGWAVVDVNYGGSSGKGRAYRERLRGKWGIVDVDDCCNAARYLVAQRLADPQRLAIDGFSAGGFTTLAALTFRDVFSAGCSIYGVCDLELLNNETHKFESRYLTQLVAPYPEGKLVFDERSPLQQVHRLKTPCILLQGLDDKVVPPNGAQLLAEQLRKQRLPVAHLEFAREGHGWKQAETIKRALEAEYYFFSKIFGLPLRMISIR
eukprot:TRINITY_DN416_c0_g1_i2.p1 TRINITY_DN416_c0_g1~~TRINITY_DN416_c0_g1_i2.p1  ORF type:complete len:449 (-),score=94.03 TRINITY_DN416_c0_g1_i2:768-1964(-)